MTDRLVFGSERANRILRDRRLRRRKEKGESPKERSPMTDRERYAARRLWRCRFLPGSYNKRFARAMDALANEDDATLTEAQRNNLWRLVYRHRRQIHDDKLIREALEKIKELDYG